MDKISVIIPVYNVEDYLDRSIESVVNQTYENLEIILVDDGSPDNSPKMCDEWAKKDKRIKVIHKENGGVSSARNLGMEKASGKYVAFVDSDDILDKEMYQKLYDSIKNNNSDVAMCKYAFTYEDNDDIIPVNEFNLNKLTEEKIFPYLIGPAGSLIEGKIESPSIMGSIWRALYKKDIIKDLKFENLKMCEDLVFIADLFKKSPKISIVDEFLYNYLQRNTSAAHKNVIERNKRTMKAYEQLYKRLEGEIPRDDLNSHKFHFYSGVVSEYLRGGLKKELKEITNLEFMKDIGSKQNYKSAMKSKKSFKYKVAYWFTFHKLYCLETLFLKLSRR